MQQPVHPYANAADFCIPAYIISANQHDHLSAQLVPILLALPQDSKDSLPELANRLTTYGQLDKNPSAVGTYRGIGRGSSAQLGSGQSPEVRISQQGHFVLKQNKP
uniref:Uncharacterized protein n=1 Tax=Photinus pyralis TaxID=7054 RepID=A0A1Y1M925_PHOPY